MPFYLPAPDISKLNFLSVGGLGSAAAVSVVLFNGANYFACNNGNIYKKENGVLTVAMSTAPVSGFNCLRANSSRMFLSSNGSGSSGRIYSSDDGIVWTERYYGTVGVVVSLDCNDAGEVVALDVNGRLYYSTNNGLSFSVVNTGSNPLNEGFCVKYFSSIGRWIVAYPSGVNSSNYKTGINVASLISDPIKYLTHSMNSLGEINGRIWFCGAFNGVNSGMAYTDDLFANITTVNIDQAIIGSPSTKCRNFIEYDNTLYMMASNAIFRLEGDNWTRCPIGDLSLGLELRDAAPDSDGNLLVVGPTGGNGIYLRSLKK